MFDFVSKPLIWLLLLLALLFSSGCVTTLTADGEVGVRWGNEIAFFHRAPDDSATSEISVPILEDLLGGEDQATPGETPVPAEPVEPGPPVDPAATEPETPFVVPTTPLPGHPPDRAGAGP